MIPVLIDTNVLLDGLLNREPFAKEALELFGRVERRQLRGVLAAVSVNTAYLFCSQAYSELDARKDLADLAHHFLVVSMDDTSIRRALDRRGPDYEDNLVIESAVAAGCEAIITRNVRDYRRSPIPAMSPGEWLARKTNES